jgi:hypothetical protein
MHVQKYWIKFQIQLPVTFSPKYQTHIGSIQKVLICDTDMAYIMKFLMK